LRTLEPFDAKSVAGAMWRYFTARQSTSSARVISSRDGPLAGKRVWVAVEDGGGIGGTETYSMEQVAHWLSMGPLDIEMSIPSFPAMTAGTGSLARGQRLDGSTLLYNVYPVDDETESEALARALRSRLNEASLPDVVVTHLVGECGAAIARVCAERQVPCAAIFHYAGPHEGLESSEEIYAGLTKADVIETFRHVTLVGAVSGASYDTAYRLAVEAGRDPEHLVHQLGPALDSTMFHPGRIQRDNVSLRVHLLGLGARFVLLFPHRPTPEKGLIQALIVLKRLKEQGHSDVVLLRVGEDDPKDREQRDTVRLFRRLMKRWGLTQQVCETRVEFNRGSLVELYGLAHATLSPSANEAFGLINLESSLTGVPVFGWDTGGVSLVVSNDAELSIRFLSPVGDIDAMVEGIIAMKADGELWQLASARVRERALAKFGGDDIMHRQVNFLLQAMARGAS
jgi:glycosyltransferase involved in cell wall biosynthesis